MPIVGRPATDIQQLAGWFDHISGDSIRQGKPHKWDQVPQYFHDQFIIEWYKIIVNTGDWTMEQIPSLRENSNPWDNLLEENLL